MKQEGQGQTDSEVYGVAKISQDFPEDTVYQDLRVTLVGASDR